MSFNPASYAVAGFVDVTHMSRENRKRLAQNDDEGYVATRPAVFAAQPAFNTELAGDLLAAAKYYDSKPWNDFCRGKGDTCRDLVAKLERFGSFASDKQADYAKKLIGWAQPRQQAPVQAPASPVAASKPVAQAVTLPKLFALMQRLSKLTIGDVTIARKNQDSLCWVKLEGVEGVVGKIENGALVLFAARLANSMGPRVLTELLTTIEADPEAAAVMHGRLSGRCSVCSRDLTDPSSIERGIGPICLEKF